MHLQIVYWHTAAGDIVSSYIITDDIDCTPADIARARDIYGAEHGDFPQCAGWEYLGDAIDVRQRIGHAEAGASEAGN